MQRSNEFVSITIHIIVNNKLNVIFADHNSAKYKEMCIFPIILLTRKTKPVIKPNHSGKRTTIFVIKHNHISVRKNHKF